MLYTNNLLVNCYQTTTKKKENIFSSLQAALIYDSLVWGVMDVQSHNINKATEWGMYFYKHFTSYYFAT